MLRKNLFLRYLCFLLLNSFLASAPSFAQSPNPEIARADNALKAAAPRAEADPTRPIYHITAPANWMNDPNGPIYYHGQYHLFYQLNPYGDGDGPKYWGHVVSRDLAKWKRLPVALWPSTDQGETGVWSGCCTINDDGDPMIFYTSVTKDSPQMHAEQWAAIGDKNLITWQKSPSNPVLSESLHGSRKIYEWRDPFIFKTQGKTFLVTGGNLNKTAGGQAVVNIYEAQNAAYTEWKYRGVMFQLPDPGARTTECPNFFALGDKWVLLCSPYGPVQYYIGDFNPDTCRFEAHSHGRVDNGDNFYAPNTLQLDDGRRIMWGWVTGFPGGRGWNGSLTIPRVLSISSDGKLLQTPEPQLRLLRQNAVSANNSVVLQLPHTNTFEIHAQIQTKSAANITMTLQDDSTSFPIDIPIDSDRSLDVRIFLDRTVLEVFANGSYCATRLVPLLNNNAVFHLTSSDGSASVHRIEAWQLRSIWQ